MQGDPKNPDCLRPSRKAQANIETLYRIFTLPEGEHTTLGKIDREISTNLNGFLKDSIVASDIAPVDLEKAFLDTALNDDPIYVSDQAEFLLKKVVAQSVHVSSPSFIGHMTSAIPYFMLPLAKIMIALNQNLVKIETSKAFTPLERQVIGMLHRLVYDMPESFYRRVTQDPDHGLGVFCSGGTIANITALWVAINKLFPPRPDFDGVGSEGLLRALKNSAYEDLAILVSDRGHYSLAKAANLLGIGRKNLIAIPSDQHNKIRLDLLEAEIDRLKAAKVGIVAIVGIAGTTETGSVDPLPAMARLCRKHKISFHVDAAWGGPTLFSTKHRHLLDGIAEADSVTFDAHKQLYVPMGAGMVVFKDSTDLSLIAHSAQYIVRKGSRDLGRTSIEGSRPGMAMLVHSGLRVIGKDGYGLLIDLGIEKAAWFAEYIRAQPDFELVSEPELNILTYRYVPAAQLAELKKHPERITLYQAELNALNIAIQKEQRETGRTFVSRTTLTPERYGRADVSVFRVVLANPLTTHEILVDIIDEQRALGKKLTPSVLAAAKFI